jgi:hypothetical protein
MQRSADLPEMPTGIGRWARRAGGVAAAAVLAGAAMLGATGTASAEAAAGDLFNYLFPEPSTVVIYDAAVQGQEQLDQACGTFPTPGSDGYWCDKLWASAGAVAELGEPNGRCLHVHWIPWNHEQTVSYRPCDSSS